MAAGLVALAGCGPRAAERLAPEPATVGAIRPPRFGDADPHLWPSQASGRSPASYPVHGVDLSRWEGEVDWPALRDHGVNFGWLKATEGGDLLDPLFHANRAAARRAGVPVGGYHFWYHCRPAREQARWFIRNVPRGGLPPVLDMEWTPFSPTCTIRPPGEVVRAAAEEFLEMLTRHYGQRPLVYVAPDVWHDCQMWRLTGYEFWLRSVAGHPDEQFRNARWTFWQYSGTGLVPGADVPIDLNAFAGSPAAWRDWLSAHMVPG